MSMFLAMIQSRIGNVNQSFGFALIYYTAERCSLYRFTLTVLYRCELTEIQLYK